MSNFSSVSVRVKLHEVPTCVRVLSTGLVAIDVATGPILVTAVLGRAELEQLQEAPTRFTQWSANLSGKIARVDAHRIVLFRCRLYVNEETRPVPEAVDTPEAREREREGVAAEFATTPTE